MRERKGRINHADKLFKGLVIDALFVNKVNVSCHDLETDFVQFSFGSNPFAIKKIRELLDLDASVKRMTLCPFQQLFWISSLLDVERGKRADGVLVLFGGRNRRRTDDI